VLTKLNEAAGSRLRDQFVAAEARLGAFNALLLQFAQTSSIGTHWLVGSGPLALFADKPRDGAVAPYVRDIDFCVVAPSNETADQRVERRRALVDGWKSIDWKFLAGCGAKLVAPNPESTAGAAAFCMQFKIVQKNDDKVVIAKFDVCDVPGLPLSPATNVKLSLDGQLSIENLSLYRDDRWSSDSETALAAALAHIKAGIVCLRVRANSYNFEALFDRACRYSEFWIVQQDNREANQAAADMVQPSKLFDVHLPEICVCATNGALYCSDVNLEKSSAIWRSLAGIDLIKLCGVLKEVRDEVMRAASVVSADADTASVNVNNGSASRQRRAAATVAAERIATWSAEDVAAHTCNLDDYEIDEDETKSTKQERTKWSDLRRLAFCLSFCAPYGRGLKASALPVIEMAVRTLSFMQKELRSAYDKETDVERKRAVYGGKSFETAPSSLTRLTPRFKPKLQSTWFASYSLSAGYLTESTFLRNVVLAKDVADNYNGGKRWFVKPTRVKNRRGHYQDIYNLRLMMDKMSAVSEALAWD
jgi:hypothetical protein